MTQADVLNFFNTWMNKPLDTDGYPSDQKYQCVDVVRKYFEDVVKCPVVHGNAMDYWYNYPNSLVLQQNFTRISNTLTFIPKLGDVWVWDRWGWNIISKAYSHPFGHVGIQSTAANWLWFTSFDQNWKGPYCTYISHNYVSPKVLGVLRPKALGGVV